MAASSMARPALPDGTYVGDGGPITRAPDGTYVAGTPQRAPDGRYLGGGGPVRMAPDGSFVVGTPAWRRTAPICKHK